MCKYYIIIKGADLRSFLIFNSRRKEGKRSFSYLFVRILYCLLFQREKLKASCFPPLPQITKTRTIKSTSRFELYSHLCFGKADMAEMFRLEQQGGFGRNVRIAFFRTFFSKKKVHKGNEFSESFGDVQRVFRCRKTGKASHSAACFQYKISRRKLRENFLKKTKKYVETCRNI